MRGRCPEHREPAHDSARGDKPLVRKEPRACTDPPEKAHGRPRSSWKDAPRAHHEGNADHSPATPRTLPGMVAPERANERKHQVLSAMREVERRPRLVGHGAAAVESSAGGSSRGERGVTAEPLIPRRTPCSQRRLPRSHSPGAAHVPLMGERRSPPGGGTLFGLKKKGGSDARRSGGSPGTMPSAVAQTQMSCGSAHRMPSSQGHRDRSWKMGARAGEGGGGRVLTGTEFQVHEKTRATVWTGWTAGPGHDAAPA